MTQLIAVIADTHLPSLVRTPDALGPGLSDLLSRVDLILHAGDVIAPSVLAWCRTFAPIRVARGNNDLFDDPDLAQHHVFELHGWRFGLTHEVRPESRPVAELLNDGLGGTQVDVLIAGDTHVQRLEFRDGVVVLNPGSPTLPHHKELRLGTAALIHVTPDRLQFEIVVLGQTPERPNPGTTSALTVTRRDGRTQAI
ncbi:MAG: metallophosphoesterase family protein [Pseudomonadota bacterium]